ncbi:LVIVD repeat-containing protein [Herbidospora daliensis]|uniref:LVIVD repeat-containing protein n=1 Tax=Herbidospora daliensis TaxID=295585 RepID=UPI0007821201|nr:hypothetical protein [Herbidospora daliensis]
MNRRTPLRVGGALAVLALTFGSTPGVAAPSPAPDAVLSSPNVKQVANIPKPGPFAAPMAPMTDLVFTGDHAIAGNFEGFVVYDIRTPTAPKLVSQVLCPGAQNDLSVHGDLLFLSTDDPRSDDTCKSTPASPTDPEAWEGIKIFDIKDKSNPRYVGAVRTPCGSHTNTLVPGEGRDKDSVFLYVSSYGPAPTNPTCQPPHNGIAIVKVPVKSSEKAKIAAQPVLFPGGGNPADEGATWFPTSGCHDLAAYPAKDLMAGACMGDGILIDISDRLRPRVIDTERDVENFAFWHSALFNDKGDKVVFTDELGGGMAPTCNKMVGAEKGANAVYTIEKRRLVKQSYYKIPREQGPTENCVAHYGSLVPVAGRDVMVQAWYQGGVSVWEFTDPRRPKEIAYFDRPPLSDKQLMLGGAWSAYYYNGYVYATDTQKGLDVLDLTDPGLRSAKDVKLKELNAQTQYARKA